MNHKDNSYLHSRRRIIMEGFLTKGIWSSGTIPASGAGGPGFNSRNAPTLFGLISKFKLIFNNCFNLSVCHAQAICLQVTCTHHLV